MANNLLNETEIIVSDGKILFNSLANKRDKKIIKDGQWGGIGGRFGKKIAPLINLPKNVLDHFNSILP